MRKKIVLALAVCLILLCGTGARADEPQIRQNAVSELYSAEGIYTDSIGNIEQYSFHVPQIGAETPDAADLNREIAERFGTYVEDQLRNMEGGYSLWMWNTEWHAYWHGSQLFLVLSADMEGGFTDYNAYGYDFEKECRVTNMMILEQFGYTEEEYLQNLREKVGLMLEDMYGSYSAEDKERFGYDEMYDKTLGWVSMEQPMFIDGTGGIETIVKIASVAGAEWYYHLATPFAYG